MIEVPHLMQALMLLLAAASLATTIIMTRGKAAADKVTALEAKLSDRASDGRVETLELRMSKVEDRITRTESVLGNVPDKETSHRLEMAIARLEGRLETMDERMKPVAAMANRVHERLFEEAAR
ncbi:hypothetical protein [Xanthobacter sp. 126]|uniref:hypothetical protein n=1 Tax=Xanthobacter sp. 126 TaxID=1131814 RepID=UPI00045E736D|nr:hypothetical protein [Xanthobacter sp. 126]